MIIAVLIGVMIAIVVGVNLIPAVTQQAVDTAEASGEPLSSSVTGLMGIIPIIFIAVILLGALAWMATAGEGESFFKLPKLSFAFLKRKKENQYWQGVPAVVTVKNDEALIGRVEKASQKWGQYHNNLDKLLGVETTEPVPVIARIPEGEGLHTKWLEGIKKLWLISSNKYDWYITDKHPERDMFKVVGLHKKDANKNLVYLLGKNEQANKPYLVKLPEGHMFADFEHCLDELTEESKRQAGIEPARELVGVRAMRVEVPTLTYAEEQAMPTGIYVKSNGDLSNWNWITEGIAE